MTGHRVDRATAISDHWPTFSTIKTSIPFSNKVNHGVLRQLEIVYQTTLKQVWEWFDRKGGDYEEAVKAIKLAT